MTAKSTSIGDLPTLSSSGNETEDQETMMVNSILQEIENDDDINTSESAINYTIDTSQIPPKINESIPTKQIIEETAKEIFQQPIIHQPIVEEPIANINNNLMENDNATQEVDKQEIKELLSKDDKENKAESLINKIINKSKYAGIILVIFVILTLPKLNKIIIKFLPKMAVEGPQLSLLGNILKGVLFALIYFGLTFVI